jgi:hypothetical protein
MKKKVKKNKKEKEEKQRTIIKKLKLDDSGFHFQESGDEEELYEECNSPIENTDLR